MATAVALAGVVLLVAPVWGRPLDCGSDAALAASYRTRFFLRIALALLGFVGFLLTGNPAVYPIGAAFHGGGLRPPRAHGGEPRPRPAGARPDRMSPPARRRPPGGAAAPTVKVRRR